MPKLTYATCRNCGAKRSEKVVMSHSRLCPTCSEELLRENVAGLRYHRGPALLRWRRGMAASVGGVLLDDVLESE